MRIVGSIKDGDMCLQKTNPADYLMWGATLTELAQLNGWWKGPVFLFNSQDHWPHLGMVSMEWMDVTGTIDGIKDFVCLYIF